MTELEKKEKLEELRKEWINKKELRKIIEVRAKLLRMSMEEIKNNN